MGILHSREEYLPVTCAVLKDSDRQAFFDAVKKARGSRPEQIAHLANVPKDMVQDWMSGKANVPYHALQLLAHTFNVPMPPVGELRREYQEVVQAVVKRREMPTLPPLREPEPRREGRKKGGQQPRR